MRVDLEMCVCVHVGICAREYACMGMYVGPHTRSNGCILPLNGYVRCDPKENCPESIIHAYRVWMRASDLVAAIHSEIQSASSDRNAMCEYHIKRVDHTI